MNLLGERIRQRRLIRGLTLKELSKFLESEGVSLTQAALSNYEKGINFPSAQTLLALARVLGVGVEYFFESPKTTVRWLAYRHRASMTKRDEQRIISWANERVSCAIELMSLFPLKRPAEGIDQEVLESDEAAEDVAIKVRRAWRLDELPIPSLTQLLEDRGWLVLFSDLDCDDFDGIAGTTDGGVPVVVSKEMPFTDRKRMNLAHEVGHHYVAAASGDDKEDERFVFRFAAALLIPAEIVRQQIGLARRSVDWTELAILKKKFGISLQALVRRLSDLGIISQSRYVLMNIDYKKRNWHKGEPVSCSFNEEPLAVHQAAFKALAEGIISEERASRLDPEMVREREESLTPGGLTAPELLSLPTADRDRILSTAAEASQADYRSGGRLRDFDAAEEVQDYPPER